MSKGLKTLKLNKLNNKLNELVKYLVYEHMAPSALDGPQKESMTVLC